MSNTSCPGLTEELVNGYDEFQEKIKSLTNVNPKQRIFIIFVGNDDEGKGSWCPDCRVLEPLIAKVLPIVQPSGILLRVLVGNRPDWKSTENPFRTDKKLRLTSIPTLIEWGTGKRLSDGDAENEKNIETFFRPDGE